MNSLKSLYLALPALILFATTILSTCDNENLFKGAMTHRGSGLPIEQIAYNCESEYICTNSTKSVDYCGILTCNEDKWEGEHLCQKYNIRGPKTCPSLPTLKNGIYVGGGCFPNTWSRSVCTYICQNGFKAASIKDHQCQKEIGTIKCQNSIWEIPKCSLIPTSSSKDFFRPVTEENRASILLMSPDTSTCFYYIPELYSVRKIILENGEKAYSCNKGYFCNNPAVITTELSKFCGVFTCASGSWSLEVWCIHTCTEPFTLNPQLQPKSTEDSCGPLPVDNSVRVDGDCKNERENTDGKICGLSCPWGHFPGYPSGVLRLQCFRNMWVDEYFRIPKEVIVCQHYTPLPNNNYCSTEQQKYLTLENQGLQIKPIFILNCNDRNIEFTENQSLAFICHNGNWILNGTEDDASLDATSRICVEDDLLKLENTTFKCQDKTTAGQKCELSCDEGVFSTIGNNTVSLSCVHGVFIFFHGGTNFLGLENLGSCVVPSAAQPKPPSGGDRQQSVSITAASVASMWIYTAGVILMCY